MYLSMYLSYLTKIWTRVADYITHGENSSAKRV